MMIRAVLESSRVVTWCRTAASTSILCALLAPLWRGVFRACHHVASIGRNRPVLERVSTAEEDVAFGAVVETSLLVRLFDRSIGIWRDAAVPAERGGFFVKQYAELQHLASWQRVRMLGWVLSVGIVTRLGLLLERGAIEVGAVVGWSLGLAIALVMVGGSRQVAAAWDEWWRRPRTRSHPT